MADETAIKPSEPSKSLSKADAVKAYYDAKTPAEKAAVVASNPVLKGVFSEANHNI